MRLAAFPKCYLDALCVDRSMTIFEWIDLAEAHLKPIGVTGLETYPASLTSFDPGYIRDVRQAHASAGFEMPMLCASPDFTSPDPAHRQAEVEKQKTMIALSADLGGSTCRVLSGQRRPEVSEPDGIRWVVECIRSLLPCAAERGVTLVMENHFKDNYWQFPEFAQRADRFCAIVDQIESPWFAVNFDPSNTLLAGENPIELLERVKHRVRTMHASDRRPKPGVHIGPEGITDYTQLVHGEVGTGLIDYAGIFRILRSVGFDGWVSIEDGVNGIAELERSARFLADRVL